jgi:hypothetical protein
MENLKTQFNMTKDLIYVICYLGGCAFIVIMGMFFKFHVQLVTGNSTTIEYLEMTRNPAVNKIDEVRMSSSDLKF